MKTLLSFFFGLLIVGFSNTTFAQSSSSRYVELLVVNDPAMMVKVPNTDIIINIYSGDDAERNALGKAEIHWIQTAGFAIEVKVDGEHADLRTMDTPRGKLASFAINGNSKEPFSLSFADVDDDNDHAAGRQKNRRVEMTIEFD